VADEQVNRTASLLARSPFSTVPQQDEVSLSDTAVSLLEAKTGFDANADVVKVADEMQKRAISMVA